MRFMILRKADSDTEAGMMPGDELIRWIISATLWSVLRSRSRD